MVKTCWRKRSEVIDVVQRLGFGERGDDASSDGIVSDPKSPQADTLRIRSGKIGESDVTIK